MPSVYIINVLSNFDGDFVIGNIIGYCIRWIGWMIIQGLARLSDGIESITDKIYTLNDFFESSGIKEIIDLFKPVLFVSLGLAIVYIGYKLITDRDFKGTKVINNMTLSVIVIMLLPTLMVKLNEVTKYGLSAIRGGQSIEQTTTANQIIKSNLTDLYYLDKKDFAIDKKDFKNNIPVDVIKDININEEVDDKKVENKEVFKNKVVLNENGKKELEKLKKEFFGLSQEKYFRFNFNFWVIGISLLCSILVILLTSIKVARLVYELAFIKIFAIFYAFADIGSGNGIRQILKHILSVFAIIFTTSVLLKIYTLFSGFVSQADLNMFAKMIFIIGGSVAVIDAPNIVERVLGIDAGLKSAWGVVAGSYAAVKTTNELGKVASSVGSGVMSLGSGAKGVADGLFSKNTSNNNGSTTLEEQMQRMDNVNSDNPTSLNEDNTNNSNDNMNKDSINSSEDNKNSSEKSQSINDSLDSKDTNSNENNSLNQDNNIGENYGARSSLSEDIESKNAQSSTNADNIQNLNGSRNGINNDISSINSKNLDGNSNSLESQMSNNLESSVSNPNSLESSNSSNNLSSSGSSFENKMGNNLESNVSNPSVLENSSSSNRLDDKYSINSNQNRNDLGVNKSIDTRTYGSYVKDKMSNSNTMKNVNKHYQLGQNTGIKLKNAINKNINKRK